MISVVIFVIRNQLFVNLIGFDLKLDHSIISVYSFIKMLKVLIPLCLFAPVAAYTGQNSPFAPGNENLPSQEGANFGAH